MEGMRTQQKLARIQAQTNQLSEHYLTTRDSRPAREGENSKCKMPKLPAFVDRNNDRFLASSVGAIRNHEWMAQGKLVHSAFSTTDTKSNRGVLSSFRERGHILSPD